MRFLLLIVSCVLMLFCAVASLACFQGGSVGYGFFYLTLFGVNLANVIMSVKVL